ncbi:MAG TPA: alcohol dehydrogenase catalytic domain-containing protein [Herpetosiphonaceae bacterium]
MSNQTMLAAVFARPGVLELQQRPIPRIVNPDDVLIEVEGCGICGTDLHILEEPPGHPGTPGVIMGHEYIGRVLEVGPGVHFRRPGERVALAPNLNCGLCRFCRIGRPNHCENFSTLGIFRDGGLARYSVAPERACYPIADHVPFEDAVWTEVLSCVVNSVDNVKALPGQTAVVIGGGPVGALHALLFLAAGARVIVADVSQPRLDLLRRVGVHTTINVREADLSEAVRAETGFGAEIVVDAVGTQLGTSLDLARMGGRISLFGMNSQALPPVRQNTITRNELTIYGSYVGVNTFPRAITILEQGTIKPSCLISQVASLAEIHQALAALRDGAMMKIVIRHDLR